MTTKNASLNDQKISNVQRQAVPQKQTLTMVAALFILIMTGANLIFWQSEVGHAIWVLLRVIFRLIPPTPMVGGIIIALLWLSVMRRLW